MTLLSHQKNSISLAAATLSATAELTGITDIDMCVPFLTTRITATSSRNADSFEDYTIRADFLTGPDRVRVQTDEADSSRAMVAEVTVAEFDPDLFNVYKGTGAIVSDDTLVVSSAFGGSTVDLGKALLYFTYSTDASVDVWRSHALRGRITDVDELTFNFATNAEASINWYVIECKGAEWSVQPINIAMLTTETTQTQTETLTAVTAGKAFIFGSRMGSAGASDGDGNKQNTLDIELTNGTTVTGTRLTGTGQIDWSGFLVEFNGSDNVYRGKLTTSGTSPTTDSIGATIDADKSTVHTCGHNGVLGGPGNDDGNSSDVPHCFYGWTLTDTQVSCAYNTATTFEAADVTWEVIEWDVGGAAPAARRVMVIS